MSSGVQHRGTCKWFNSKKGFGFLVSEGGEEFFVHQSEIKADGFRNLAEGEEVEFRIENGPDGRPKAVGVTGPMGECVRGDDRRRYESRRRLNDDQDFDRNFRSGGGGGGGDGRRRYDDNRYSRGGGGGGYRDDRRDDNRGERREERRY